MNIDRRQFWTDVASGLVIASLAPFLPRVLLLVLAGAFLGLVLLFVLDAASGGSALEQVAEQLVELFGSR